MESRLKEIKANATPKGSSSSWLRGANQKTLFFQPKLTIGPTDDVYEREADAVAEKVMRMGNDEPIQTKISPVNVQRKYAECEEEEKQQNQVIQRQEENEGTDFTLPTLPFLRPSTGPDFLSMRQPFLDRHIFHLWDPGSALQVWNYNFNFFRRFGLTPDLSTTLTNLTAPRFIDSQLKASNPTWWEITDRDLNTTTYNLSVPLIDFNADFSPTAPSWLRTIFGGGSGVQRKCKACAEEGNLNVQRKDQTTSIHDVLHSSGESLPDDTRSFMENRIGYDFSKVKVHKNTVAAKSAQSINALAYTSGDNIVFNDGQYSPNTESGKKLLAHELAHVVQQSPFPIQRKPKFGAECEPFDQCQIEEGLAVGMQYVDQAITHLTPVVEGTATSGVVVDKLNLHFKTSTPADVKIILGNFNSIKNELSAEILYVCHKVEPDDCKSNAGGAVGAFTTCAANSDVSICLYFKVCGCQERGRMMVHELAHHLNFCTDFAYRHNANYATLPKEKAMKNADCYATLASELFTGSPPCIAQECYKGKLKNK